MKANPHHPPHILLDDSWYFLTASTYEKKTYLRHHRDKHIFNVHLHSLATHGSIKLAAWVILDNHYHLLLQSNKGEGLQTFIQRLHGRTSFELNKVHDQRGRQVWHNYWDTLVMGKEDFWVRYNYIHYNPVKHGYVTKPEDWEFSSYVEQVKRNGQEWMDQALRDYPIVDFMENFEPAKASTP